MSEKQSTNEPPASHAPALAAAPAKHLRVVRRFTRPWHRCDTVGRLIVYYRELKGWSQKQLRMAVGLSQSRLSSLERDERKAKWEELDRIAFFLEQPSDAFSMLRRRPPPADS